MKKQDTHTHSCINWLFSVIDNLEIKNKVLAEEISDVKDNKNQFIKKNQDAISKYSLFILFMIYDLYYYSLYL